MPSGYLLLLGATVRFLSFDWLLNLVGSFFVLLMRMRSTVFSGCKTAVASNLKNMTSEALRVQNRLFLESFLFWEFYSSFLYRHWH